MARYPDIGLRLLQHTDNQGKGAALHTGIREATGDYEFVCHLSAPCPYFELSASRLYVLSPKALAEFGVNDNRAAVSTGPVSGTSGQSTTPTWRSSRSTGSARASTSARTEP